MLTKRSLHCRVPLAFSWSHAGVRYRVTPWPDVCFEKRYGDQWIAIGPTAAALAAGVTAGAGAWQAYLEFVPADVREFLTAFRANRLMALQVAARCPEIVGALGETPALTAFLAEHPSLRGVAGARWREVNATFERGGIFGILEWLGLPASKEAIAILRNLVSADLAPGLVEPLRQVLWRPEGVFALAQLSAITERDVADACALAA